MYCRRCGKQLPDGTQFCVYCGTPVTPEQDAAPGKVKQPRRTGGKKAAVPAGAEKTGALRGAGRSIDWAVLGAAVGGALAGALILLLVLHPFGRRQSAEARPYTGGGAAPVCAVSAEPPAGV